MTAHAESGDVCNRDDGQAYRLVVVSAGMSQASSTRLLADRLAAKTREALGAGRVEAGAGDLNAVGVETVDLRDHAHAIADAMLTGFPAGGLADAVGDVVQADGLILVTPTFSASYSGLFKCFVDILDPDSLQAKPVLLGATGGTERHSLMLDHAMRPLMNYLRAAIIPTAVYAASEDWGSTGLDQRIERAAGELAAVIEQRPPQNPAADGFADPVPFAQLLNG